MIATQRKKMIVIHPRETGHGEEVATMELITRCSHLRVSARLH